ncbi:MAG: hypothetical protein ACREV2_12510, partial [Burkholderiales bacterium]
PLYATMEKSLTISKLDAAKRQLETVIRMYFNSGDPVAMHTLAAAGFNVIRDLNKKRGGGPMLQDKMFEYVKPEHHKLLREKMSEAQNFFKHADRDHEATLEFNPDSTEFLTLDACYKYAELTGEFPPLFQIYSGWMMITHKEIFTLPDEQRRKLEAAAKTFTPTGKAAYFTDMLPMVMKSGV